LERPKMNDYEKINRIHEQFRNVSKREPIGWPTSERGLSDPKSWRVFHCEGGSIRIAGGTPSTFDANWAEVVPEVITRMVTLAQEKKKRELEFNLIQFAINGLEQRIQRIESLQTKIIPIDSFAPEPYVVLKPILAVVHSIDEGFEAGWFDANIYFSGGNEEEALSNLKGRILDDFDSFSGKATDKLGPGPTRQLAVMREYIQKRA